MFFLEPNQTAHILRYMAGRGIVAIAYLLKLEKNIAIKKGGSLTPDIKCFVSSVNRLIEPFFNLIEMEISALCRLSELQINTCCSFVILRQKCCQVLNDLIFIRDANATKLRPYPVKQSLYIRHGYNSPLKARSRILCSTWWRVSLSSCSISSRLSTLSCVESRWATTCFCIEESGRGIANCAI